LDLFTHQLLSGLATGAIYGSVALAVVMIYLAIDHFNFAQGEMAMFSTFVCWAMLDAGVPYWMAFTLTIAIAFLGGVLIERVLFRPLRDAPVLSHIIAFLGLFFILNSGAGAIWEFTIKPMRSPFPDGNLGGLISLHELGMVAVTILMFAGLYLFVRCTSVGLAMQAAAQDPESARLCGVRVGWMIALGWGMASAIGAVAGMLIAPVVFLEPNMMLGILLYGFAAAVLGGINSPGGAVLGGFIVGVLENLVGTYVPFVGSELKLTVALVLIVAVLVVKPSGLLGTKSVTRV
jgi:branched-chain amino acid transport system permease protein